MVLGGGRNRGAPEWGGETVNGLTLQRVRYGARLARETGLPLYVTGGKPDGGQSAEGTLMRDLLAREFNVEVKWVDAAAATTRENALMAARDLRPLQINRLTRDRWGAYAARTQSLRTRRAGGNSRCYRLHRAAPFCAVPASTRTRRIARVARRLTRMGIAAPSSPSAVFRLRRHL